MIAWCEIDQEIPDNAKRKWRRCKCAVAISSNGVCHGYSRSVDDDEPCDICKACDRLIVAQGIGGDL